MDQATKQQQYRELASYLNGLFDGVTCKLSNAANAAAAIYHTLQDVSWAGFYLADGKRLTLGCFCGRPACTVIEWGRGVCGVVAATLKPIAVSDVTLFSGHIACDALSRSEAVIPLQRDGVLLGVLDLDSHVVGRFDQTDISFLTELAPSIVHNCF